MKILITGSNGQLGLTLQNVLNKYNLILTDRNDLDITNADAVNIFVNDNKPNVIIHAAAYTKVDKAEEERDLAYNINALGTKNVAEAAHKNGSLLIYISTDYVFNSKGQKPLKEDDPTDPVNYYGQTKLAGEEFIQNICQKYYIIRTAWLYGELPKGHPGSNFVETMLRLAKGKDQLTVVNDQIGSPTYTGDLVNCIIHLVKDQGSNKIPYGVFHYSGDGETTWYQFAKTIFDLTKTKINLKPISTANYPTLAKRPFYSYLSKEKVKSFGIPVPPWQEGLKEYLTKRSSK